MRLQRFLAVMAISLACSAAAHAEDAGDPGNWWLNAGGVSHHFNRYKHFNEHNFGLGIEYKFDAHLSAVAGEYRNSVWHSTRYAGLGYTPLDVGPLHAGLVTGFADGYPKMKHGGFFPIISPLVTLEGKRFGVNLLIIPSIASNASSALGLQLKMRL